MGGHGWTVGARSARTSPWRNGKSEAVWIRSGHSDPQGGRCVEWAPGRVPGDGLVPVRDSKDVGREPLMFSTPAWAAFVGEVKRGAG